MPITLISGILSEQIVSTTLGDWATESLLPISGSNKLSVQYRVANSVRYFNKLVSSNVFLTNVSRVVPVSIPIPGYDDSVVIYTWG